MQKVVFVTALCLLAGATAGAVAGAPGGVIDEVQGDNRRRRVVRRR